MIQDSDVGRKSLVVPWNVGMFATMQSTQANLSNSLNGFMGGNSSQFLAMNPATPHLGNNSFLSNWGVNSLFAGPFGGASMFGNAFAQNMNPMQLGQMMFNSMNMLNSMFSSHTNMGSSLNMNLMSASLKF